MKIVHCVNHYMPLSMAGTEVYIHTLASMQKLAGHEVAVVTPHIEYYRPGQIKKHYVYDGIDVHQFLETADPKDRNVISGKKKPEGLSNFRELISSLQPDIIHFHELNRSIGLGIEHVKLAKQSGAKIILTMHLSSYTCNTNTLINHNRLCGGKILEFDCSVCTYKTMFNMPSLLSVPAAIGGLISDRTGITSILPTGKATTLVSMPVTIRRIKRELMELSANVDQFVSLAEWYKKILLENGVPAKKLWVIPQALATIKKQAFQKNTRAVSLPLKLVFLGRIQPQKGIHLLIEALRHFTPEQVCIDIYGKPEETMYYNKCINDSAGIRSISWKGGIAREEVVGTLAKYDMLCLPSTFSEMSSLVIQEAFAAGIPVLASKVYGNIEQITNRMNGLLFEFNSSESLREQLQDMVNDPSFIEKMKHNIVAPLSFDEVYRSYLQVYNSE